ncbi:MAG: hypothetical protein LBR45_04690, partial [Bacteroidales bacterium]|nr:hypothetical protein [Bacteroidales bacterium]
SGLSIGLQKNKVTDFSLSGCLNIPPFGTSSLLPYTTSYDATNERYIFRVNVQGNYKFPALHSTLTLNELSSIEVQYKDKGIYPIITAHGKLSVDAPLNEKDSTKKFSVPDIAFENLKISREAPYFDVGYVGVDGEIRSPNIGGFEIGIDDIRSFKADDGASGIAFVGNVSLGKDPVALNGEVGIQLYGDYVKWKFKKIEIDKVRVSYKSKPFSIEGGVWFKDGDAIYGDGFRGDVKFELIEKFKLDAVAIFGKKDDFRYFMVDVFLEIPPSPGLPVAPGVSFYGFGGGLYSKMQQTGKSNDPVASSAANSDFGKSLSEITYLPDKKVAFGLMASTKFSLQGSPQAANAKVGLEMQFNNHGGLNFVQLRGDLAFMDMPDKWGSMADNIVSYVSKLNENTANGVPKKRTKSELEKTVPANKNNSALSASILMEYDNINDYFNADLSVYMNVAGVLKGVGTDDRLGWANAYFAKDDWHIYLGTPNNRLGIKVLNLAELDGYFMLGNGIPGLPEIPKPILDNLSADKRKKLTERNIQQLGSGKGIAFGAGLHVGFDASFLIFYAKMKLGLGTEFMLTQLNGVSCEGIDGTPGINGWFAQGQAWAYVEAAMGLQVKMFGKQQRFPIFDVGTYALLEAKGPKPMYFAGAVGGRYSILGGLIKGTCNFEFEIGDECIPVGGSPFGEDVIAQLTPAGGSSDVNVFTSPQVVFNIPIEVAMDIDEDDGRKGTYRAHLEELRLNYKGGASIAYTKEINDESTVCMLVPDEPFESQKEIEVYAKVSFQERKNNNWVTVKNADGSVAIEEKRTSFKSGDRPKEIMPEHVVYSYPLKRQYNYYPKEYAKGYILVSENYAYLFSSEKPEGFDQKIRISTAEGHKVEKNFTYTTNSSVAGVKLEINFSLESFNFDNNKIYHLSIVNVPAVANASMMSNIKQRTTQMAGAGAGEVEITHREAEGSVETLSEKLIYNYAFKTSRYNTFADKMRSFSSNGWRDPVYAFIHDVGINLAEPELFDAYEMGTDGTGTKLVKLTAQTGNTDWYNQTLYNGMYQSQTYLQVPNDKIVILQSQAPNKKLSDDEINVNVISGYGSIIGAMRYQLPNFCAKDLHQVKNDISRRIAEGISVSAEEREILKQDFPPVVFRGNYPVTASYILPGKNTVTSNITVNIYNPVEN